MSIKSEITRLQNAKTSIATAIKNKGVSVPTGTKLDEMSSLINNISTGITPSGTLTVTKVGTYDVTNYASATFSVSTETKTVTPSASSQSVTPSSGKYLSKVTVNAIPSSYIIPSGTKTITSNGTSIDVTSYKYVNVNVASSGGNASETFKLLIMKYPSGGDGPSPWSMRAVVKPTSTYHVYFDTPIIQNGVYVFPGINASEKLMLTLSETDLTTGVEVELPMYSAYIVGIGDGYGNSMTISFMQATTTNMRTITSTSDFGTVDAIMAIPCNNNYTDDTLYVHI